MVSKKVRAGFIGQIITQHVNHNLMTEGVTYARAKLITLFYFKGPNMSNNVTDK